MTLTRKEKAKAVEDYLQTHATECLNLRVLHGEEFAQVLIEDVAMRHALKVKMSLPEYRARNAKNKLRAYELEDGPKGVRAQCVAYLRTVARKMWANRQSKRTDGTNCWGSGNVGIPDEMGVLKDGRFYAFEMKHKNWTFPRPTDTRSYQHCMRQKAWLDDFRSPYIVCGFVSSVEDVIDRLTDKGHEVDKRLKIP